MRRTVAALAFIAVMASAAASYTGLASDREPAMPRSEAVFLVPSNDGYGIGECLTSGGECGQIVADAWCSAQGYARAVSYGRAEPEDMTGSLVEKAAARTAERPIAVTCAK